MIPISMDPNIGSAADMSRKAGASTKSYFTTREFADALGLSESSVKRWANEGKIRVSRTVGGHRRIPFDEALRFIREAGLCVVKPEVLGLDYYARTHGGPLRETGMVETDLYDALNRGDAEKARQIILGEFYSGRSIAALSDGAVAQALEKIGTVWETNFDEGVYIEHRAMDICFDIYRRLQTLLTTEADHELVAIGGAPGRDVYALPTLMASAVLLEQGYTSVNLGAMTPMSIIARAARDQKPRIVWLAMNAPEENNPVAEIIPAVRELAKEVSEWGGTVVVGGRAVPQELRDESGNGIRYLHSMGELAEFCAEAKLKA